MAKGMVEADSPFRSRSLDFFRESQDCQTLLIYKKDREGEIVPPWSVLRMHMKKEEVSFCTINFMSKTNSNTQFDS